jgi:hypothetical protein
LAPEVVEIGMNGKNRANSHLQACLLEELPPGRITNILTPLHVTAGNTPLPLVRAYAPHQKDFTLLYHKHRDPYGRISVVHQVALGTVQPLSGLLHLLLKSRAAVWAKSKRSLVMQLE